MVVGWLLLLVGVLLGVLSGVAVSYRAVRDEMLVKIRPQLNVIDLKIDNLRGELDLLAQRQEAIRRELAPPDRGAA